MFGLFSGKIFQDGKLMLTRGARASRASCRARKSRAGVSRGFVKPVFTFVVVSYLWSSFRTTPVENIFARIDTDDRKNNVFPSKHARKPRQMCLGPIAVAPKVVGFNRFIDMTTGCDSTPRPGRSRIIGFFFFQIEKTILIVK